jgi:Tol biopolymer transport system component
MNVKKLIISLVIVCLLLTMVIPMAAAPKPDKPGGGGGGGKPPKDEPPANPTIAYVMEPRNSRDLYVMNSDGTNSVKIHSQSSSISLNFPTWSPDGNSIAFGKDNGIWAINVDVVNGKPEGSNLREIASSTAFGGGRGYFVQWSPSGDELAVTKLSDPSLWTIPAIGGTATMLYSAPPSSGIVNIRYPTWNEDGTKIAFTASESNLGPVSIWIFDVNTETVTSVLGPIADTDIRFLEWARTKDVIAYMQTPVDDVNWEIYTLDIGSSQITKIVSNANSPSWSPDDSQLAYEKIGGKEKVYVFEFSTGNTRELANGRFPDWVR